MPFKILLLYGNDMFRSVKSSYRPPTCSVKEEEGEEEEEEGRT